VLLKANSTNLPESRSKVKFQESHFAEEEKENNHFNGQMMRQKSLTVKREGSSQLREKVMGLENYTSLADRRRQSKMLYTRSSTGNKRRMSYFD